MKRCLIMITSGFPYGISETYIESEVAFLKDHFERVIILPIELDPGEPIMRALPEGIEYYNVSQKKQSVARTGDIVGGLRNIFAPTDYYKWDKEEIGSDFRKRMFFEYFCNRSVRSYRECLKVLKNCGIDGYDTITVYSYWFFATAFVGVMLKKYFINKAAEVKLISRAHGYDVYEERNALNYLPLRRFLLENCDAVYPCSDVGTEHIVSRYPEYADKVKTAHLGTIDAGLGTQSEEGLHIVSCSLITDIKRIDKIIDILEKLEKTGKYKIKWTHIGDGNRRTELEKSVRKKLKKTDTEFLGNIPNNEVYEFYRNNPVDLFISTSKSEGLPVSMMEAASFGIPIVSTDVGGVREIVESGYNGQLLGERASADEFADFIKRYYDMDKSERDFYRENSRKLWERSFSAGKAYPDFFSMPVLSRS